VSLIFLAPNCGFSSAYLTFSIVLILPLHTNFSLKCILVNHYSIYLSPEQSPRPPQIISWLSIGDFGVLEDAHQSTGLMACTYPNGCTSPIIHRILGGGERAGTQRFGRAFDYSVAPSFRKALSEFCKPWLFFWSRYSRAA
jgi:hypothetical protein